MAQVPPCVSVITPVYNAAPYVARAVESALAQPEVAEVILVEDGSQDASLAVCQALAAADPRVRLFRHPDGRNHGAGATRNLALQHSTCPLIAFLDADDYFLPGRFAVALPLLAQDPTIDGVYEAIGADCEDDAARARWLEFGEGSMLTTVRRVPPPEGLFAALVTGASQGHFSGDGLVVRRTLLEKTGLFDEHLPLHQDTAMWLRMAALGRLVPGRLEEPVAMRGVHASNRIMSPQARAARQKHALAMWATLWHWSLDHLAPSEQELVLNAYLREWVAPYRSRRRLGDRLRAMVHLTAVIRQMPRVLTAPYFYKLYVARMLRYAGLWNLFARLTGRPPETPAEDRTP